MDRGGKGIGEESSEAKKDGRNKQTGGGYPPIVGAGVGHSVKS